MISVHGNKTLIAGVLACCVSLAMVLASLCLERRIKVRLYEKEAAAAFSELEEKNQKEISGKSSSGSGEVRGVR